MKLKYLKTNPYSPPQFYNYKQPETDWLSALFIFLVFASYALLLMIV